MHTHARTQLLRCSNDADERKLKGGAVESLAGGNKRNGGLIRKATTAAMELRQSVSRVLRLNETSGQSK